MSGTRVGCTGWGYDDWRGGFYAPGTPPSEYLSRYARVFDLVEVDSSYYQPPDRAQAARWAEATPPGFTFALKLPRAIVHDLKLQDAAEATDRFLAALDPLRAAGKLGPLVAVMPPSFRRDLHADALRGYLAAWPRGYELVVELRHPTWWREATYDLLRAHGATLGWSVTEYGRTPPVATTDLAYVRLVGNRTLTRFDRVQRDVSAEVAFWAKLLGDSDAARRLVLLNNHLAGFAPASADAMARALGLAPFDLARARRAGGQPALDEFA
ncbi:MAG TPA: DUF72 domain-containing protein [Candidatus Thermoplasmatota archaeon]|nr:DUF72 domain-containing protein [Candidatus Thermoplasmatota archaeon]